MEELKDAILDNDFKGTITGILHTKNDSIADIVKSDETNIIYGKDYFMDKLLGLDFKVSAFSFFQTNTLGAEKLYSVVRDFVGDTKDKVVFDLYCGTGTIGQIVAKNARKVIGIELVEEALARDLQVFEQNGYKVKKVVLVNQFPRTNHIECVIGMQRKDT